MIDNRSNRLPQRPAFVACLDGHKPDCTAQAVSHGHMPRLILDTETALQADCVIRHFSKSRTYSLPWLP